MKINCLCDGCLGDIGVSPMFGELYFGERVGTLCWLCWEEIIYGDEEE